MLKAGKLNEINDEQNVVEGEDAENDVSKQITAQQPPRPFIEDAHPELYVDAEESKKPSTFNMLIKKVSSRLYSTSHYCLHLHLLKFILIEQQQVSAERRRGESIAQSIPVHGCDHKHTSALVLVGQLRTAGQISKFRGVQTKEHTLPHVFVQWERRSQPPSVRPNRIR